MTTQCCRCKRFRVKNEWVRLAEMPQDPVSHGFCPVCMKETLAELDANKRLAARNRRRIERRPTWVAQTPSNASNF